MCRIKYNNCECCFDDLTEHKCLCYNNYQKKFDENLKKECVNI